MKLSLPSLLLVLAGIALTSCETTTPPSNDTPVVLPSKPKHESFYVSGDKIKSTLTNSGSQISLTFEYQGALLARTRHNVDQARAVAKATNSPELANQQFLFIVGGNNPSSTHASALLEILNRNGVKLHQFHIEQQATSTGSPVLSNFEKTETPIIMKRY